MNRFRGILIRSSKKPEDYLALLHLVCAVITYRCAGLFGYALRACHKRRMRSAPVGCLMSPRNVVRGGPFEDRPRQIGDGVHNRFEVGS
jgi:hypothetical protein